MESPTANLNRPVTIVVNEHERVSGLLWALPQAKACYVLAHGAGAGMTHPFLSMVAKNLAGRGIATLRYQFPYMEKRSKRPELSSKELDQTELVETDDTKRWSPGFRNALLILLILMAAAALAVHYGFVSSAMERFGFSTKRKPASTTSLEPTPGDLRNPHSKFAQSTNFETDQPQGRAIHCHPL